MNEKQTAIEPISERLPYHDYSIQELWSSGDVQLSARALLDITAYVQENRQRLEQEAQEDYRRNERAMSADMADMHRIKQEWHGYRHAEDETGPLVPKASDFREER